ncbi:DUF5131 family protein [Streptomyces phaeoluteigriseus]|uniref:DUF5131 family protein n=1 Tax=Streptomyces phaeoluteigriseus TaxID=114686 RepID=UPI000D1B9B55
MPGASKVGSVRNRQWARSIRDQCGWAEVPFFPKQWGSPCNRSPRTQPGPPHPHR